MAVVQMGATFGAVSQVLNWTGRHPLPPRVPWDSRWFGFAARVGSVEERAWRVIEEAAGAVGVTRASDEGPEAFLERLRPFVTDTTVLNAFRNAYLRSRFGNGPTPPELVESAHQVAKTLKQVKGHR
ncbi:MAG: hypothetical protein R3E66_10345 [bacterium]